MRIDVEDTRIGMEPDQVPELFEAFSQESCGLSRIHGGTGLGLALTRRIVDQMGGSIDVQTEKKAGTRTRLAFPMTTVP